MLVLRVISKTERLSVSVCMQNLVMSSSAHPFNEEEAAELLQAATDSKTGKIYIDDVVDLLCRDRSIGLAKMLEPASA